MTKLVSSDTEKLERFGGYKEGSRPHEICDATFSKKPGIATLIGSMLLLLGGLGGVFAWTQSIENRVTKTEIKVEKIDQVNSKLDVLIEMVKK